MIIINLKSKSEFELQLNKQRDHISILCFLKRNFLGNQQRIEIKYLSISHILF